MATNTYVALDKVTVSSSTPSITFNSINSGYTDLVIVCSSYNTVGADNLRLRFNGDSTGTYSQTRMTGNGSTATSGRTTNDTAMYTGDIGDPSVPTAVIINVQNYSNTTTNKTVLTRGAYSGQTIARVGLWRNTAAITSITLFPDNNNIAAGSTFSLYGIKAQTVPGTAKATGGTITYDNFGYVYHTFTSTGTFTPTQSLNADILLVAGGGGGAGWYYAGGGGAGGLLAYTNQSLTATGYTCTVGGGGAGGGTGVLRGSNGIDSTFGALTSAAGGGGGGNAQGSNQTGANGGSGGGAGGTGDNVPPGAAGGTATPAGQGNNGGYGFIRFESIGAGGGGGGAGAVGSNGASSTGGAGGIGSSAYSSWGLVTSTGQNVGGTYYYAGGGGGGGAGSGGAGGYGGGASGRGGFGAATGIAGTSNTGGGGGAADNDTSSGGAGGSGLIIVRYQG